MKIENNNVNPISSSKAESVKQKGAYQSRSVDAPSGGAKDVASLSEEAMMLVKFRAALEEAPEVRSEQVQALQQSVSDGTYKVPVDKLASALMRHFKVS